ncbi:MAG: AmmeMemoRadiSam system protein B [Gammaproteobacteria bacterium]|nr:AmmeMemoRadiSam system protein B [Gammaproteobacteria bacterium]
MTGKSRVRPSAVAGLFYPQDARQLRDTISHLLDEAVPGPGDATPPKALIVPHAGYVYSGAVAASAYRRLRDSGASISKVVLIGPSHRVPMRGRAMPSVDAFETPLGEIPIDVDARQRLRELGLAGLSDAAHAAEHSLEVQLPFLQVVLPAFQLLPIATGLAPPGQVTRALEAVWNGPSTLIVVSSDLSHYHTSAEARTLDEQTKVSIVARRSDLSDEQACGSCGINGLMEVARHKGLVVEVLDQRNSGDTAGDRSRVVGYGSYALHAA